MLRQIRKPLVDNDTGVLQHVIGQRRRKADRRIGGRTLQNETHVVNGRVKVGVRPFEGGHKTVGKDSDAQDEAVLLVGRFKKSILRLIHRGVLRKHLVGARQLNDHLHRSRDIREHNAAVLR